MTPDAGVQPARLNRSMAEDTSRERVERVWPLAIFFCLAAASTWVVWLWPVNTRGRVPLSVLGLEITIPFLLMKIVIGSCLPGILAVVWARFEGKGQFQRLLSTLTRWRTSLDWYALVFTLPWAVFLVAQNVVLFFYPVKHPLRSLGFLNIFVSTLPFGPLWEELAWRAFALRKLETRYSRLASALIIGAYWAVWHIPLRLLDVNPSNPAVIPILLTSSTNVLAWSVVWAYIYHSSSESLPVVILLHATYNAAWSQVFAAAPLPQLIYVSSALAVCLAPFFARGLIRVKG